MWTNFNNRGVLVAGPVGCGVIDLEGKGIEIL